MFNSSEPCFISPEPCSVGLFIFQAGARNLGIDSLENQHTRQEGESALCGRRVAKSHVTGGPFGLSIHIKIKCEILFFSETSGHVQCVCVWGGGGGVCVFRGFIVAPSTKQTKSSK